MPPRSRPGHLKELLRQRCFYVRQRTAIRNHVHFLLGTQRNLEMPQVNYLFGRKGVEARRKLRLDEPSKCMRPRRWSASTSPAP